MKCLYYSHEKQTIMDLAAIQIQALVRQAQNHYLTSYATKIGRALIGPTERMEIMESCKYWNEKCKPRLIII